MSDDPFGFSPPIPPKRTVPGGYKRRTVNHAMDIAALTALGDPEATGRTPSTKRAVPNHYDRVKRWAEGLGFWCFKVERLVYDPRSEVMRKQDLLGFADMLALKPGPEIVAIQVTTKAAIRAHVRKFVDQGAKSGGEPVAESVRKWLDAGCRIVILGFEKAGHNWVFEEVEVTHALLDEALARRRKQ